MAVDIKPGQWVRSKSLGWSVAPAAQSRAVGFVNVSFDGCVLTASQDNRTAETEFDIIEVSDTDPRQVAETSKEPEGIEVQALTLACRLNEQATVWVERSGSLAIQNKGPCVCIEPALIPKLLNAIESLQERRLQVLREIGG